MGVNHGLALAQIGNKYPRTRKTITSGRRRKWIPSPRSPSPGRQGPAMGSNYHWMPADRPIPPARAVGPGPQAFSRQIASSALESNLLPAHRQTENVRQADGCLCCPGQCGRMNRKVGLWGTGAGVWIQEADDEGEIYLLFSLPMEFGPQTPATGTVRSKCREREGRTEFFPRIKERSVKGWSACPIFHTSVVKILIACRAICKTLKQLFHAITQRTLVT